MQKTAVLPNVFQTISTQVSYVQQKSQTEYSSSCPKCGGYPHERGEWPDRFVMFLDDRPRGWCRKCGYLWWPDGESRQLSHEEQLKHKEAEERELKKRKAEIEIRLAELREDKAWLRWHMDMDTWGKQQWYNRGLPDEFQDYWKLGVNPQYKTSQGFVTPSLSIPCFSPEWKPTQIYHRLLNMPPEGGKYRQTYGLDPALFVADPDWLLDEQVIVVEGQIKAQHVFKALLDNKIDSEEAVMQWGINVVAVPSSQPNHQIFKPIKDAKRVYIILDPDAQGVPKRRMADILLIQGVAEVYAIDLYDKVDDMILRLGLGSKWLDGRIKRAVKI